MRNVPAILRREVSSILLSPVAYVTGAVFLFLAGMRFASEFVATRQAEIQPLVNVCYWLPVFLAPLITMRLLSEEKRSGTFEVLMTAPITDAEVVVGKFLGALSFYAMLLAPTAAYVFVLWYYAEGPLDYGTIAAGYVGILLVGGLYLSLGLLASSLTQNQILAAAVGFIFCFIPVSFELVAGIQEVRMDPVLTDIVTYLTVWPHYRGFGRGFVDTRDICYFVSLTAFSLYLTTKVLESRRWL